MKFSHYEHRCASGVGASPLDTQLPWIIGEGVSRITLFGTESLAISILICLVPNEQCHPFRPFSVLSPLQVSHRFHIPVDCYPPMVHAESEVLSEPSALLQVWKSYFASLYDQSSLSVSSIIYSHPSTTHMPANSSNCQELNLP